MDYYICDYCVESFDKKERKPISLNCGHTICFSCLVNWKNESNICPICRQVFSSEGPNYYVINFLDQNLNTDPESLLMREIKKEIRETEKNVYSKCKQKLETIKNKTNSVKSLISEKASELVNKILSRQNFLVGEADRIQMSLNERVNHILNVKPVDFNCDDLDFDIFKQHMNETKLFLNSNKYELDRLENNIEFQLDNQNLYEIGEFTNTNDNVIYIYDFSTHFKFIIHNYVM